RRGRLGALPQLDARLLGPLRDQLVEVVAGDDVAVAREAGHLRTLELEHAAERDRTQAGEPVAVLGQCPTEPHVVELFHGSRSEPDTARLLTWEALLLDEQHVVAGLGQPVRTRRPGGPGADNEDIPLAHRHSFAHLSAGHARRRRRPLWPAARRTECGGGAGFAGRPERLR